MNFLTREQYLSCFASGWYAYFVGAFWRILFEVNPDWQNMAQLVTTKGEWLSQFYSIGGMPYNRTTGKQVSKERVFETSMLMQSLAGMPERVRGTGYHPVALLIYPFVVRKWGGKYRYAPNSYSRGKKKYETLVVHLNEARRFVTMCNCVPECELEGWLSEFDHSESRYQDLEELIAGAKSQVRRLQILKYRANIRKHVAV